MEAVACPVSRSYADRAHGAVPDRGSDCCAGQAVRVLGDARAGITATVLTRTRRLGVRTG